nr:MAG TPA: hypothetical protein [Crassvirales sp.]
MVKVHHYSNHQIIYLFFLIQYEYYQLNLINTT